MRYFCGAARSNYAAQCRPRRWDEIAQRYRPQGLPAIGARVGEVGPGYGDTIFPMACFLPQRQKAGREFSVVAMIDVCESVYANLASSSSSRD